MNNFKLSVGDVKYIINRQAYLNELYHGKKWMHVLEVDGLKTSAMFEYIGEFGREIEGLWKHFGNCPINREAALFELVDTVSYICSYYNFEDNLIEADQSEIDQIDITHFKHCDKPVIRNILNNYVSVLADHSSLIYCSTLELITFVAVHLFLIDVSADQFMLAYEKKSALNMHRAMNGAVDGSYDKTNENKPTVQLNEPCNALLSLINLSKGLSNE